MATRPLVEWPRLAAVGLLPAAVCCLAASLWSYPPGGGALLGVIAGQWHAADPLAGARLSAFELAVVASGLAAVGLALSWGRGAGAPVSGDGLFDRVAFAVGETVTAVACRAYAVEALALDLVASVLPASLAGGAARWTEKTLRARGQGGWWTAAGATVFLAYMLWRGG